MRKTSAKSNHEAHPATCTQLELPHEESTEYLNESESTEGAFGASSQPFDDLSWIGDSGASSSMTQSKELLVNYEEFEEPHMVSQGVGHSVKALGKGNIQFTKLFKVSCPKRNTMFDVLYVPKLTFFQIFFSVRAAVSKGNYVKFGNDQCYIRNRDRKLLGIALLIDKLYYFELHDCL